MEVWDGGGGSVVVHYTTGRVNSTCVTAVPADRTFQEAS